MILPFDIEFQKQSQWCWAATAKSVSYFYSRLSTWTQCKIAGDELTKSCCNNPLPVGCDEQWYLDRALARTNNFTAITGTVSWQEIDSQLKKGIVLCARVEWHGGGGHFMVIHGTSSNGITKYLHIDDPIHGKSVPAYDKFLNDYLGLGSWTHTYYTKQQEYDMWFKNTLFNEKLLIPVKDFINQGKEALNPGTFNVFNSDEPILDLPHYSFVLRVDDIKKKASMPETPSMLRIMNLSNQEPLSLFEVTLNEEKPELINTNTNKRYFTEIKNTLGLLRKSIVIKELGELRMLKIPSLNIEAYWLHYEEETIGGTDLIAPLKLFESDNRFEWNRTYSPDDFTRHLAELAAKIDTDDKLLGG